MDDTYVDHEFEELKTIITDLRSITCASEDIGQQIGIFVLQAYRLGKGNPMSPEELRIKGKPKLLVIEGGKP